MTSLSTEMLNTCADVAREAIAVHLAGRELSGDIRGAMFPSVETRMRRDLRPALNDRHNEILERWAK